MKKVYIVANAAIEIRRKNALQRMKDQLSQSNRNAEISSGISILFVDGKIVFSVKDGKVSSVNQVNNG